MMIVSQFLLPLTIAASSTIPLDRHLTLPNPNNRFYTQQSEPKRFKDTMNHNYMTTQDLIKEIIEEINSIPIR